jgi:phosphoribosylanthranilate isomerase
MLTQVKVCGITRSEDALTAAGAGVNYIGVIVEVEESPRAVSVTAARDIIAAATLPVVIVLDKETEAIRHVAQELHPFAVQLVGDSSPDSLVSLHETINAHIWKTVHVPQHDDDAASSTAIVHLLQQYHAAGVSAVVLDTLITIGDKKKKGGTGQVCNWNLAKYVAVHSPVPVFLAGGITPDNVRVAICSVHPYGIDLSSGVEYEPGKKDPQKIAQLMQAVMSTRDK